MISKALDKAEFSIDRETRWLKYVGAVIVLWAAALIVWIYSGGESILMSFVGDICIYMGFIMLSFGALHHQANAHGEIRYVEGIHQSFKVMANIIKEEKAKLHGKSKPVSAKGNKSKA